MSLSRSRSNGHETLWATLPDLYEPYDRIHVQAPDGKLSFTVLGCDPVGDEWRATAIRCFPDCTAHHTKR